jgi:hypothetical protein
MELMFLHTLRNCINILFISNKNCTTQEEIASFITTIITINIIVTIAEEAG